MEESNSLLYTILEVAIPLVVAALGYAARWFARWQKTKIENDNISTVTANLTIAVNDAVAYVSQTYVSALKAARAPESEGGSVLTDTEKSAALRAAVEAAKSYLGTKGLAKLMEVFGLSEAAADTLIAKKVEAAVGHSKVKAVTVPLARSPSIMPPPA